MATADNRRGLARRRLLAFGAMTAVCLSSAAASAQRVIRGTRIDDTAPPARPDVVRRIGPPAVPRSIMPVTRTPLEVLDGMAERSLSLYNVHTAERLDVVYWRGGYLPDGRTAIDRFMRDWRENAVLPIAEETLNILCALDRLTGTDERVQVLSGYRTPQTNEMLRRSGLAGVARDSLHMQGRAVDFHIPGVLVDELVGFARSLSAGGVGYYPRANFVHVDNGLVRNWTG